MRQKTALLSGLLMILFSLGCAHTYSSKEFNAIVDELNSCTSQLKMAQDENATIKKLMDDTKKDLEKSSSDLLAYRDEKQQLLDKNIQCLEEKNVLLQQISRFNDIIQERKEAQ